MAIDELEPIRVIPDKPVLDEMSIDALNEYISELEEEIARVRQAISLKEAARGDAENVFKS
ncbi:MAG: DUF1192 domain-containing protein [Rhodospirillales bacterium]